MLRPLHSWPGLIAALLILCLSVTGAALSISPVIAQLSSTSMTHQSMTVAQLAATVQQQYPEVEQIHRKASGVIIVDFRHADGATGRDVVDAGSGRRIAAYTPSSWITWMTDLHRSLLMSDPGRIIAAIGALAMLLLTLSGMLLLHRRLGGWKQWLLPVKGSSSQRLHNEVGRLIIIGLLCSSVTALYLTAAQFELISDGSDQQAAFPESVSGTTPTSVGQLKALQSILVKDLREMTFPYPDDPGDVFSLRTAQGEGYVDQSTGVWLSFQPRSLAGRIYDWIYRLHTGEGMWAWGILLGLSSLAVPLMAITGIRLWWRRFQLRPRFTNNSRISQADTVILIGTEGNSTWEFANTLHQAMVTAGAQVHSCTMNELAPEYPNLKQMLVLTSTYGEGGAPASGRLFRQRLGRFRSPDNFQFAVVGFGDRQFPRFCQFAWDTRDALLAHGAVEMLPLCTINQQSSQVFNGWGRELSHAIGRPLNLEHKPKCPKTLTMILSKRTSYGEQDHSTAVLQFIPPIQEQAVRLPDFEAGDLLGVLVPGHTAVRYYSLASSRKDGYLEICVRRHKQGLCSGYLHGLKPGDPIELFIQKNPHFRPASRKPVILIGAGTGIGPLSGFIRGNRNHQPMYLYWGGRHPESDFLYQKDLHTYLADQRLTNLSTAFSRIEPSHYVQDKLMVDRHKLQDLVQKGAQILVCGGREMAHSVASTLDQALGPIGISIATLKAEGRYREDIY
ncbi:PepSY-associated TM helix domain-containing protein [Gynuella sp.]|uniref:PepSY-associated TM helix domain-containing protein n=1 Tax=Gynuella sp. TaxID=2969146 RepID=UPI003D0AB773